MELSEKELEVQAQLRKEIEKNIDFYVRNALTAEQTIAINRAKRNFYNHNKSIREFEADSTSNEKLGGNYAFTNR